MGSVANHWKRFLNLCTGPNPAPGSGVLLRKSAGEWQRLYDLVHTLMLSCPVSRLAVLDQLTPIFGDYFVYWWQRKHQSQPESRGSDGGLEDLQSVEHFLKDVLLVIREAIRSNNISDGCISGVCSWVLSRLRPACVTPPTQMLGSLRRLLNSANKHRSIPPSEPVDGFPAEDLAHKRYKTSSMRTQRIRETSPSSDSSEPNGPQSDTDPSSDSDQSIDHQVQSQSTGQQVDSVEGDVFVLDMDPRSAANRQLLGIWRECEVLMELLQLAYELLMGSRSRLQNIQALLAIATVPLPPDLKNLVDLSSTNYTPSAHTILPHWVLIWLLYQTSRQSIVGVNAVRQLVDRILDASIEFPLSTIVQLDSTAAPDTLAIWLMEQRLDADFWATACLTHLLFLGDGVPTFIFNWFKRTLNALVSSSSSSDPLHLKRVFRLMLHLGCLSVPTPPTMNYCASASGFLPSIRSRPFHPADNQPISNLATPPMHGPFLGRMDPANRFPEPLHVRMPPFSRPQSVGLFGSPSTNYLPPPPSPTTSVAFAPTWIPPHQPPFPIRHQHQQPSEEIRGLFGSDPRTAGRQPASLVWLLSLAKRIRAAILIGLSDVLGTMKDEDLKRLCSFLKDWTSADVESHSLLAMANKALLSAADDKSGARILAFLLKAAARPSASSVASATHRFAQFCSRLLDMTSASALVLVYTSSEAADNLNRGGCEGILRATMHLAEQYPIPESSELFRLMTPTNCVAVGRLIVAVSLTLKPSFITESLITFCISLGTKLCAKQSSPTSLSQFFIILEQFEQGLLTRGTAFLDFDYGTSPSMQLLTRHFLPAVWNRVRSGSGVVSLLRSITWLSRSENCTFPQFRLAFGTQIVPIVELMSYTSELEILDLLTSLLESTSAVFLPPSAIKQPTRVQRITPTKTTTNPSLFLSTVQCLSLGRLFVQHLIQLIKRVCGQTYSEETLLVASLLHRTQSVLLSLAAGHPLLLTATLRCLPEKLIHLSLNDGQISQLIKSPYALIKTHSVYFGFPFGVGQLPDHFLEQPSNRLHRDLTPDSEHLLLANPPPVQSTRLSGDDSIEESLVRGRLRRPKSDRQGSLKRRAPGAGSSAFGHHIEKAPVEEIIDQNVDKLPSSDPIHFFWLDLINNLLDLRKNRSLGSSPAPSQRPSSVLGTRLQDILLPYNMHIAQTSTVHLPTPIAMVLPPSGASLERVLGLLHLYCPKVKAQSMISRVPDRAQLVTACMLEMVLMSVLDADTTQLLESIKSELTGQANTIQNTTVTPSDPFLDLKSSEESTNTLIAYTKLLLGLFMGLEASWGGALAPRASVPDTMAYLTGNNGRYTHGLFPVFPCSKELLNAQARRIAVDYGQRRVDYRSSLFRLTKRLLFAVVKFAICHDHQVARRRNQSDSTPSEPLDTVPIDRLLHSLTPREMAILLSDVRRNLRLRLAFDRVQHCSANELPDPIKFLVVDGQPLPPPPPFITPGLLMALIQTHLMEPGIADLVMPLFKALYTLHPTSPPVRLLANNVIEEFDVDGEVMVVLSD